MFAFAGSAMKAWADLNSSSDIKNIIFYTCRRFRLIYTKLIKLVYVVKGIGKIRP